MVISLLITFTSQHCLYTVFTVFVLQSAQLASLIWTQHIKALLLPVTHAVANLLQAPSTDLGYCSSTLLQSPAQLATSVHHQHTAYTACPSSGLRQHDFLQQISSLDCPSSSSFSGLGPNCPIRLDCWGGHQLWGAQRWGQP